MSRKLLEENWLAYRRDCLSEVTDVIQLEALRRAFYMGIVLLGPHFDEADSQTKKDLAAEMLAFCNQVDRSRH